MSKTYALLLKIMPRPLASLALTLWYLLIMLAIIDRSAVPFAGFIYWDR
ncbi:hypothetical protein [Thiolapillus sp.]